MRGGSSTKRGKSPRKSNGWFLRQIQLFYQVESCLRDRGAGPKLRAAVRGAHSRMIVNGSGDPLERIQSRLLPVPLGQPSLMLSAYDRGWRSS